MHNSVEITQKNLYRYPGAKSFTSEQAHLFMGRALDIEQFYALLQARQVVVLYGKSGMGKSSLINAGIVPLLQDTTKPSIYFNIRLFNKEQGGLQEAITPVNNLISTLSQEIEEQDWMLPLKQEGLLWYWLKQWQWQNPKVPIMLFFDQFEELFTYTEEEVAEFGNELRSIIYQNTADLLDDLDTSIFTDEQLDFLYQKIDFRLVFIIRSDRMALLNKLTKYVPHIQKHFYELDAISETDAKEAIIKPAQLQDQAYASKPFDYEPSIVQAIIKQVKNQHDGKIETATLQIICSYIERQKVIEERQSLINDNVLGNIQHIFRDFYQSTLNKLNKQDKDLVSQTIEVNFIQNKQRIPFAEEHLKQVYHLSQTVLDELEKSTLLRKERDTAGRFIYEIGHDTLIEPIVEFANERKAKEEQRQLEETQKQQAEEAKRQQTIQALENKNLQQALDARKQLLKYAVIAGTLLIGLLGYTILLWRQAKENLFYAEVLAEQVKEQAQIAIEAQQHAQQALNQVYYQQAKAFKDNADNILRNKDAETARYYYDSARVILEKIPETDSIATKLKSELQKLLKK